MTNRSTGIKYEPGVEWLLDVYLNSEYPRGDWRHLSKLARKNWNDYGDLFTTHGIRRFAYVGAHGGRGALAMASAFPDVEFTLIEPSRDNFDLLEASCRGHHNVTCMNIALGAAPGRAELQTYVYSPANSLLPVDEIMFDEFPYMDRPKGREVVEVRTLDDVAREVGTPFDAMLLDAQGSEDNILRGAERSLSHMSLVTSELSLQPLYTGSSSFESTYAYLTGRGFRLDRLLAPLYGRRRHIIQVDGVFIRAPEPPGTS